MKKVVRVSAKKFLTIALGTLYKNNYYIKMGSTHIIHTKIYGRTIKTLKTISGNKKKKENYSQ